VTLKVNVDAGVGVFLLWVFLLFLVKVHLAFLLFAFTLLIILDFLLLLDVAETVPLQSC